MSQKGSITKNITNLNQGETCNYRFYAECGAPLFKVDGEAKLFNVTYTEWEEAAPSNIRKSWLGSYPANATMDSIIKSNASQSEEYLEAAETKTSEVRKECAEVLLNSTGTAKLTQIAEYYPDVEQEQSSEKAVAAS